MINKIDKPILKGLLVSAPLFYLLCSPPAAASYTLATFLDMSPSSTFAQQHCPLVSGVYTCSPEGSTKDKHGNLYLAMALPKGNIFKVTPDGDVSVYATFPISNATDPTAVDFDAVNLRLAFDQKDNMYATYIDVDNPSSKIPTAYTGLWRIPPGGGSCSLTSGPCEKVWPATTTTPLLRFPDGVALDGNHTAYIADAQMGNIWQVDLKSGEGTLWSGTDAGSTPNYLKGNPQNIFLGFSANPAVNRGLGIVSLVVDSKDRNIYASTFDGAKVVKIPINKNGAAGSQEVVANFLSLDQELDAIYLDEKDNILYVTNINSQFNAFINFIFNGGPFALPVDSHQVYAANLDDDSPVFNSILNDPVLGTTAGVVNGIGAKKNDVLYINVFGSVNGATTPKVMTATPN